MQTGSIRYPYHAQEPGQHAAEDQEENLPPTAQ